VTGKSGTRLSAKRKRERGKPGGVVRPVPWSWAGRWLPAGPEGRGRGWAFGLESRGESCFPFSFVCLFFLLF